MEPENLLDDQKENMLEFKKIYFFKKYKICLCHFHEYGETACQIPPKLLSSEGT